VKTEFPVSEKIFAQLLHAFPRTHRERYGAAMSQLFRDQCRDAWAGSGNFGLLKLWLRALTDLAGSSIMERLAALKERKTMNDKLGDLSAFQNYSAGKTFMRVFVVVFLLVVTVSTAVTFILPETYASTATVKVENEGAIIQNMEGGTPVQNYSYDPYFIQTTFEIMKSELVLTNVINTLNLNEVWGKKYNNGVALKTAQTMEILKNRMSLAPVRNAKMISITTYSEDSREAAKIANQVAKSYHDFREHNLKIKQVDALKMLEQQLAAQSNQLQAATSESKIQDLKDMRSIYLVWLSKVQMAKIDCELPAYNVAQITDKAEPAIAPIRPNRPLNITIGVIGGSLLASIVGALVLVAKRIARRKAMAAA
jgi:uncharacterized protein involved in exopolysaccharide biosynthesis